MLGVGLIFCQCGGLGFLTSEIRFCVLFVGRCKLVLYCALFVYDVARNTFLDSEFGFVLCFF